MTYIIGGKDLLTLIGNSPETLTFAWNNPYKKLSMLSSTKEQGSGMSKLFNTWKNTQQEE